MWRQQERDIVEAKWSLEVEQVKRVVLKLKECL